MNCKKCEKYEWPDWQQAKIYTNKYGKEFTDKDGKDACVFHAACNQKNEIIDQFNNDVFDLIRRIPKEKEKCYLNGTEFPGDIDFGVFKKGSPLPNISFNYAEFWGESVFKDIRFGEAVSFYWTHFHKKADFSKVKFEGDASFIETIFAQEIEFEKATFEKITIFDGCKFNKQASFFRIRLIKDLRFIDIECNSIINANFLETPIENVRFQNIKWQRDGGGEDARYKIPQEDDTSKLMAVAEFYRQMKRKNKEEYHETDTSLWHFAEKETQLKYLIKPLLPISFRSIFILLYKIFSFRFIFLLLYKIFSGYGESPRRALIWLFILITVPFLVLAAPLLPSFIAHADLAVFKNTLTSWMYYLPLTKSDIDSPTWLETLLRLTSKLFITIQSVLFGFALRNKFRR